MSMMTYQKQNSEIDEMEGYLGKVSPIAELFRLGREKSYVTYEDILRYFPIPEKNLDELECIFGALLCAGIPYGEDAGHLGEQDQ